MNVAIATALFLAAFILIVAGFKGTTPLDEIQEAIS